MCQMNEGRRVGIDRGNAIGRLGEREACWTAAVSRARSGTRPPPPSLADGALPSSDGQQNAISKRVREIEDAREDVALGERIGRNNRKANLAGPSERREGRGVIVLRVSSRSRRGKWARRVQSKTYFALSKRASGLDRTDWLTPVLALIAWKGKVVGLKEEHWLRAEAEGGEALGAGRQGAAQTPGRRNSTRETKRDLALITHETWPAASRGRRPTYNPNFPPCLQHSSSG